MIKSEANSRPCIEPARSSGKHFVTSNSKLSAVFLANAHSIMTNIGQENPFSSFASESSETSETTIVVGIDGRATTPTTPTSPTSIKVGDLRYRTRRQVALRMNVPHMNDWRMFADSVGFSHLEIKNWEREHDPMNAVLDDWIAAKVPTLYDFMRVLAELGRFDVIKTLEEETRTGGEMRVDLF